MLTAGVVGLIYEWRIRESVAKDLIRLVDLDQSVVAAGLTSISLARPDSSHFVSTTENHLHVVIDVDRWCSEEWPRLVQRSLERAIHLQVVLPAQRSLTAANHMGIDVDEHEKRVIRVEDEIQRRWEVPRDERRLASGSQIEVLEVHDSPRLELRVTDENVWLFLQNPIGKRMDPPRELCLRLNPAPQFVGADLVEAVKESLPDLHSVWSGRDRKMEDLR